MEIDCQCEFGYELQLVIPYAYYLSTINKLQKTTSCHHTKELYYFSKNHNEKHATRRYYLPRGVPNNTPHSHHLKYDQYIPPPYKDIYKNDIFVYHKPLLIIHNKYNMEWDQPPVNFIDKPTLLNIFKLCHVKYRIVYIRPKSKHIVSDNSSLYDLSENDLFSTFNVLDANDLYETHKIKHNICNFNHFQLLLHSNCSHFISVQGGNAVLASYFGGTNIIFAKKGSELSSKSYDGHYKKYSNCNVLNNNNYSKFIDIIKEHYLS